MLKILNNIVNNINLFFSLIAILSDFKKNKPKFVFFSESSSYQKYSKIIIDVLCKKYNDHLYYFSTDKKDKINNKKVKNFFINPLFINFFFKNIKTENLFLTLTDIGNNVELNKKNINSYIYYFHAAVSTTKIYTSGAFDNYDIIFCNGQFQINEIRHREKIKKLKPKKLIPTGYFYFDYLQEKINFNLKNNLILIAPSWNKNLKNYFNENFINLIDKLIKKNYDVILRPHPEHFKRSKNLIDKIVRKFENKKFTLDTDNENIGSMQKAKYLITDNSGIAIEYMFILKRPVLYLEGLDKIHNSNFEDYRSLKIIENEISKKFGFTFVDKDIQDIDTILKKVDENFHDKLKDLNYYINENYFNFGNTNNYLSINIDNILFK